MKKNRKGKSKDIHPVSRTYENLTYDELEICVEGLRIVHRRATTLDTPNELTAVVPRAEIRKRFHSDGETLAEMEVILNSITVVNAPRHPLAAP